MSVKGIAIMSDYHEPPQELDANTRDFTRALNSLKEEIEAVDWYQQRIATSNNEQLRAILAHNRDEEMEHAAMSLEWLRRNMPGWDEKLKIYLFTTDPIPIVEAVAEATEAASANDAGEAETTTAATAGAGAGRGDLGIGSLRK